MKAFYFSRHDGFLSELIQQGVVGELSLPPGNYIAFATVSVGIANDQFRDYDIYYRVTLQLGLGAQDGFGPNVQVQPGRLRYAPLDNGSASEALSLTVAGEFAEATTAKLMLNTSVEAGFHPDLAFYCVTLTALQMDELSIITTSLNTTMPVHPLHR